MGAPYEQYEGVEGFEMICLSCGKHLESSMPQSIGGYYPSGGILLHSYGNFGCTMFDPMNTKECLHLFLCDACLKEKQAQILIVHEYGHKVLKYQRWDDTPNCRKPGQHRVDELFESFDVGPLFSELMDKCPCHEEKMAAFAKKYFLQKMIDGEFPLQDVLNVQVHLGPQPHRIQLRIALDEGVAFFSHEG